MKQFQTIEKLDRAIIYAFELASSLSVLLLAFGLIALMANVLTKGSVFQHRLAHYSLTFTAKEKRKKQLDAVFQRRRVIYKRYLKRLQMQGAKG